MGPKTGFVGSWAIVLTDGAAARLEESSSSHSGNEMNDTVMASLFIEPGRPSPPVFFCDILPNFLR